MGLRGLIMGNKVHQLTGRISETDHVAVLLAKAEIAASKAAGAGRARLQRIEGQLSSARSHGRSGLAAGWWLMPMAMIASIAWMMLILGVIG